jgi:type II secretory pathway component PulF
MSTIDLPAAFAYRAQTLAGDAVTGTIDAASVDDANRRLRLLQLRVLEMNPVQAPPRTRPLRGNDFLAFNTQLSHLITAGLPVEQGLRLIAQDMRSNRLSQTVLQIARELESGRSLPDAFEKYSAEFPPLYSELVHAGVRTGNLPAMLLSLGRHLELVTRLRAALWKAISYPLMVFLSLLTVLVFLGLFVFPQLAMTFKSFRTDLPEITQLAIAGSDFLHSTWPILLVVAIVLFFGLPLLWRLLSGRTRQGIVETFVLPFPIIGPALRRNLLARWCDALKLGVDAGLDLPAAIKLAGEAVASPGLTRDGTMLVEALQAGRPLDESIRTRLIPPTLNAVITLAASNNSLSEGLNTLGQMFQQQAEMRMALIPVILAPALIVFTALFIGFVIVAMFAPMIALIQSVSGPVSYHSWFH